MVVVLEMTVEDEVEVDEVDDWNVRTFHDQLETLIKGFKTHQCN